MKNNGNIADMKNISYSSPESLILEIMPEGILCFSTGAGDITLGDELDDYKQIN